MLKFLRKYQGILLVVGGSLLMVVFLLGDVIQRFGPKPGSNTVATLANGEKISERERYLAQYDLDVLNQVAPWMFARGLPNAVLSLDENEENRPAHWLLLVKEAEANGLVGEAEDGRAWVPELARQYALLNAASQWVSQLGQDPNNLQFLVFAMQQPQIQQQAIEIAPDVEQQLQSLISQLARQRYQANEEDVLLALARARGVTRLLRMYSSAPRLSVTGAVAEARAAGDTVRADALAIPAEIYAASLPPSTPQQLEAHFQRFRADEPGDNEFGIGYVLGPRIKLSYLAIEPERIREQIVLDRVEVRKQYERDRQRYPGEFADEVYRVEADMLAEKTKELMVAADQAVRAAVFVATEPLESDGPYKRLPSDWASKRPTWDAVADKVAAALGRALERPVDASDVTRVVTIDDRWLRLEDLQGLEGVGQARFAGPGGSEVPLALLPEFVRELQLDKDPDDRRTELLVQVGVPMAEQAATDFNNNRYYVTVLDARTKSPADDISELDTDLLAANERLLRGYEALLAERDELLAQAKADGLAAVADRLTPSDPEATAPEHIDAALFTRDGARGGRSPVFNDPSARAAVIDAASELPDITMDDDLPEGGVFAAAASPAAKSLLIARITGKLPMTVERFRSGPAGSAIADQVARLAARRAFEASSEGTGPFSFEDLKERWGYESTAAARPGQSQAQRDEDE